MSRSAPPKRSILGRTPFITLLSLLPLLTLSACGIDHNDDPADGGATIDIAGVWEGAFVSDSDDATHPITSLVIIKTDQNRFRMEFQVAIENEDGVFDPEGNFLNSLLNAAPIETSVEDDRSLFVSARDGDLILNAVASGGGSRIDGTWLQAAPIEEHGPWSVRRVSELSG